MLLLTPVALFQPSALQEFARALVNKPIRDRAAAAIADADAPPDQRASVVKALAEEYGADATVLSALLSGSPPPLPAAAALGAGEKAAAEAAAGPSDSQRRAAAVTEGGTEGGAPSAADLTNHLSEEQLEQLSQAEYAIATSFKLLREANTPASVRASALTLLKSAGMTGEVALMAVSSPAEPSGQQPSPLNGACQECAESIKGSYEKVSALAAEATAKDIDALESEVRERLKRLPSLPEDLLKWEESARASNSSAELESELSQLAGWSEVQRLEKELNDAYVALEAKQSKTLAKQTREITELQEQLAAAERRWDTHMSSQFAALLKVQTPEDGLVAKLMGAYLLSAMVGINASYLVSGSLTVSFGTALMVRWLPQLIIYATKLSRQAASN